MANFTYTSDGSLYVNGLTLPTFTYPGTNNVPCCHANVLCTPPATVTFLGYTMNLATGGPPTYTTTFTYEYSTGGFGGTSATFTFSANVLGGFTYDLFYAANFSAETGERLIAQYTNAYWKFGWDLYLIAGSGPATATPSVSGSVNLCP